MEVNLITLRNAPVFMVKSSSPIWNRVYGAVKDEKQGLWFFPAYHPFLDKVLHDIEVVYNSCSFSTGAQELIEQQQTLEEVRQEIGQFNFPTKSLDHQLDGTAELIHNYRWLLQWKMGTGKTKTAIDMSNYLQCKTLVLAPRIALKNWIKEIEKHTAGQMTAITTSKNVKQSVRQAIDGDFDFLITTYGSVRTNGTPHICAKVKNYCKNKRISIHLKLRNALKQLNSDKDQYRLFQEWLSGRNPEDIREEIEELINGKPQWLAQYSCETIIADESHRIKRIQSQQTAACLNLVRTAKRRVLLTGTLSHGDPRDLYPQLNFLSPSLIKENYRNFCLRFIEYKDKDCRIPKRYKNIHVLNRVVGTIGSEKTLEECIDLPERQFIKIPFELSGAQKRDYNTVVKEWTVTLPDGDDLDIANGAIRISKLLQLCSGFVYIPEDLEVCNTCKHVMNCVSEKIRPGTSRCPRRDHVPKPKTEALKYPDNPKLEALSDLLEDVLMSGKAIIWAHLTEELDDIEKRLKKIKLGYVRVDGSSTNRITEMEEQFENDKNCVVYLGQISTGIAITLNSAKYSIYYSRDFSLDNRLQSAARNLRIGQDKKTVVFDLCAISSVENQQLIALDAKEDTAKLLTEKQNCNLCAEYSRCLKDEIIPWSTDCILKKDVTREITRAWEIK